MKGPTPVRLWNYVAHHLGLKSFLRAPGDGRIQPRIPAHALLWALLLGHILRQPSFLALQALVRSPLRAALRISAQFGKDALAYFTERLDADSVRRALVQLARRIKTHKAFDQTAFIGLVLDGTTAGHSRQKRCEGCRPFRNRDQEIVGWRHHLVMASAVGGNLSLPLDVEPYGPSDSEYAAGQRLLRRLVEHLGVRFAQYVVVDGEFATAPFLHLAEDLGLKIVARLKGNLPELYAAACRRFARTPPRFCFREGADWVEIWDAEDFDPWESLRWETVRVIRYRQHQPGGKVVEAYWLTNFTGRQASARSVYRMAKSRWQIENQGFNDAKNRYGMEHICHHHPNSLLAQWLTMALALTIERCCRLRYLHRGTHRVRTAIELLRQLWFHLLRPRAWDSS